MDVHASLTELPEVQENAKKAGDCRHERDECRSPGVSARTR